MADNKGFSLEFEEAPALVFVQNSAGDGFKLYQDGKEVSGIRKLNIFAAVEEATTHEVEYCTGCTKDDWWKEKENE